jgi:hypothetical protein
VRQWEATTLRASKKMDTPRRRTYDAEGLFRLLLLFHIRAISRLGHRRKLPYDYEPPSWLPTFVNVVLAFVPIA